MDIKSGELRLVAQNPGVGGVSSLSRDGSIALLSRLRSRGSNDLYSLDTKTGKDQILTEHKGPTASFDTALEQAACWHSLRCSLWSC